MDSWYLMVAIIFIHTLIVLWVLFSLHYRYVNKINDDVNYVNRMAPSNKYLEEKNHYDEIITPPETTCITLVELLHPSGRGKHSKSTYPCRLLGVMIFIATIVIFVKILFGTLWQAEMTPVSRCNQNMKQFIPSFNNSTDWFNYNLEENRLKSVTEWISSSFTINGDIKEFNDGLPVKIFATESAQYWRVNAQELNGLLIKILQLPKSIRTTLKRME